MNHHSHLNHLNKKQLLEIYVLEGSSPCAGCFEQAADKKLNF